MSVVRDYQVSFEKQSLEGLQRLYLPYSSDNRLFGKYAHVSLSDGRVYLSRIFPAYYLNDNSSLMDETVRLNTVAAVQNRNGLKIVKISPVEEFRYIKSLKMSVVFQQGVQKDRSAAFIRLLKSFLNLFALVDNCVVTLTDFDFLGVAFILVHNIGNVPCGKVVETTKVTVERLINYEHYQQSIRPKDETSIKGFETPYNKLIEYFNSRQMFLNTPLAQKHNLPQVLVIGPPGTGKKTLIKKAIRDCKATLLTIDCTELNCPQVGEGEKLLRNQFQKAVSLSEDGNVIILILHPESICRKPGRLLAQFVSLIDSISSRPKITGVMSTCSTSSLHESIRTSSRFHYEIFLEVPSEIKRCKMLEALFGRANLDTQFCSELAEITPGYTISDLALLVHKTSRGLKSHQIHGSNLMSLFKKNAQSIEPSVLRGEAGVVRTNNLDITPLGGLSKVKSELHKVVNWPRLHKASFKRLNLKTNSGCLLYGPPGCAKTSLTRVVALESNLTFFSVSAADLYSPYVGDAEHTIANLFQRARSSAPSILFIDEIDALVGHRGGRQKGTHERILSTFLMEMDGIHSNSNSTDEKVIVIAATNRPQILDPALLRPGRFDKLIYIPPPDLEDRKDILAILTQKMPVGDLDLDLISKETELFSGADLSNLCREVAFRAMTDCGVDCEEIKEEHWRKVLKEATPSLTRDQIDFYQNFSFSQNVAM